jgi:hypothetical protein
VGALCGGVSKAFTVTSGECGAKGLLGFIVHQLARERSNRVDQFRCFLLGHRHKLPDDFGMIRELPEVVAS